MDDRKTVARHESGLYTFYRRMLQLLLPSFNELQWIIIAAMLISELVVYRHPLIGLITDSWVHTIYAVLLLVGVLRFLFTRAIPRKRLTKTEKAVVSVLYYLFYVLFALGTLAPHGATHGGWLQLINQYLTVAVLVVSIVRAAVVLFVFRHGDPSLESVVADRLSDRQYHPLVLVLVSAAVPVTIYILQHFYVSFIAPAFLAVVYVGLLAKVCEAAWRNLHG